MYKIIGADQKEYGPITADQVRQWIAEGRVNGNTRIQPEGTDGWKTVSEMPEFGSVLPAVTLPLPGVPAPVAMAPAPAAKTNQTAVWAMITGIIAMIPCCCIVSPVPIVLGIIAHSQLKQNPQQSGSGFATVGIVLGILALFMLIIGIILAIASPQSFNFPNAINQ